MRVTVIAAGRIKEKFFREAVDEYVKRLGRYCRLEIVEVEDERTPDRPSDAEKERILEREAGRISRHLRDDAYLITLEIQGREMDSASLAARLERLAVEGKSHIQFVIGASLGLHDSIKRRSDLALSFSPMTFPHQLMRVILLEQIYRAYRISSGEPYHK